MQTVHDIHFGWDNSLEPVLEISSGDVIEFQAMDAGGGQLSQSSRVEDLANLSFDAVNPVTGPVYVRGATPGDTLEVEILGLRTKGWGWTAIIPGFGLLRDEFTEPALHIWELSDGAVAYFTDSLKVPLAPFPGTIGVALPDAGVHSIIPPRQNGGNMDIRHLTTGTRLLLPVLAEGALLSVGDTHAAQGDGEVCGTAIEAPMDVALRLTVRKGHPITEPQFTVPGPLTDRVDRQGYHVTTGFAPDLMEATKKAVRYMIAHLMETYRLNKAEAYMLCSVAVDLKISEVVDAPNWLVGAYFPLGVALG